MDDRIQLVFSWDPRAQAWLKERGPENSAKPPAKPLDDGAVQTYFLDPQSGQWMGTILGARARTIGNELGTYYRSPALVGLAVEDYEEPRKARLKVEGVQRKPVLPVALVAGVVLALVVGGGAVASKTLFAAGQADAQAAASASAAAASAVATTAQASAAPSEAPTPAATPEPTAPGQTARPRTPAPTAPPRTAAPTAPPIQPATITLTATTSDGTRLTYTGSNIVAAGSVVNMTITAVRGDGEGARTSIAFRIGASGAWSTASGDARGRYTAAVPVSSGKGPQPLYVLVGSGASSAAYALGNLFVN